MTSPWEASASSEPSGRVRLRRPPGAGAHTLLVSDAAGLRVGASAWVGHELGGGSKVLYKGWFEQGTDPEGHWLVGPEGPARAQAALRAGQLEIVDYASVIERAGGTSEGLFRLQYEEVVGAARAGWPSVAMVQDTSLRPMADAVEAAAFADQERRYADLARVWPANTLCQLALDREGEAAVRESVAVHHGELLGDRWTARTRGGVWCLSGELDVAVEREFDAGLLGVVRGAEQAGAAGRGQVRIDLGEVGFLDAACASRLAGTAAAHPALPVTLYRCPPLARELLDLVGRPPSLRIAGRSASG